MVVPHSHVGRLVEENFSLNSANLKFQNPHLAAIKEHVGIFCPPSNLPLFLAEKQRASEKSWVLEIGCYNGKNIAELAEKNPQHQFLGLDITYKRCAKTAGRIKKNNLSNAFVSMGDARSFIQKKPEHILFEGICIFFPDPWEKKAHQKHRLFQKSFVLDMFQALKPGGFIWLKTDHGAYFEDIKSLLSPHFQLLTEDDKIPPTLFQEDTVTQFELLFRQKNQPTYAQVFIKNKSHEETIQYS